jgi:pimeloyl-ACP methyl ester carboxylesterase
MSELSSHFGEGGDVAKSRLRDVVVLLPGITGSVLQKDGRDVWAVSGQATWRALRSLGKSLEDLTLGVDDPDVDDLGDGVTASRLVPDAHLIPGLVKIDGYTTISRLVNDTFQVVRGDVNGGPPGNFYEFCYDWRRDNRVAARHLKALVDRVLPQWRETTGATDAKVILIGHSMGGLVARHYLEVLEGWPNCRALISFGTPYRGSLNAVGFLANGYKKLFLDLTEMMRSFTSVYQLLPIYRAVWSDADGGFRRIGELTGLPGVDGSKAATGLAFHRAIEAAVDSHLGAPAYLAGYKTLPIVGTGQPTNQSAIWSGGSVGISADVPDGIDGTMHDGDGTVPRVSAIPIELSNEYRDTFIAERHGSLQCNAIVLDDLRERLKQMQSVGLEAVRGPAPVVGPRRPGISLDLEDLYVPDEPVEMRARLLDDDPGQQPPTGIVTPVNALSAPTTLPFVEDDDGWVLRLSGLVPGLYRIEVRTAMSGPLSAGPVHDLFEVGG